MAQYRVTNTTIDISTIFNDIETQVSLEVDSLKLDLVCFNAPFLGLKYQDNVYGLSGIPNFSWNVKVGFSLNEDSIILFWELVE